MRTDSLVRPAMELLRHQTGVVIPVYLPDSVDKAVGEALLRDTVVAYCAQVADPLFHPLFV